MEQAPATKPRKGRPPKNATAPTKNATVANDPPKAEAGQPPQNTPETPQKPPVLQVQNLEDGSQSVSISTASLDMDQKMFINALMDDEQVIEEFFDEIKFRTKTFQTFGRQIQNTCKMLLIHQIRQVIDPQCPPNCNHQEHDQ